MISPCFKQPDLAEASSATSSVLCHRPTPLVLWFTGLSGAGKTTLATALDAALKQRGYASYVLDGDQLRQGLCQDLGFSEADRAEHLRRAAEVARLMVDAGLIVLAAFISPSASARQAVRARFAAGTFIEIHVATPLTVCEQRDPKGLYRLARTGQLPHFTGLSAPYDEPSCPDFVIDTSTQSLADSVSLLWARLWASSDRA